MLSLKQPYHPQNKRSIYIIGSSHEANTGLYIYICHVDKYIGKIGHDNVIQVVTDNASNNMTTTKLLKVKRPNNF